ncbi:MAG TPA: hypothetical protein VL400_13380, partial [Polyangiaceae bacterium]|nr:hypothetical protein [Polyangiaceae bacterium]
ALAVLLVGAIVGAVRRFGGARGARGASHATGATFGDVLDRARAATPEQRRARWRGCALAEVDGSPELVAIAPEADVPKADVDLGAELAASPARPIAIAGPGAAASPDAVTLVPLTPGPPGQSGAAIPVLVVTARSLDLGTLGGTKREPLTSDALRKRVRDELAADAPAWVVAVDRGAPLDQLRDALTLLEHAHGTVVLAVATGESDAAALREAPDAPGMCREAATDARPPTPAERGAYSEALGALATACAEKMPWTGGGSVRMRFRFEHGNAPLACVERDDAMSPALRRCLLDGARDLPAVDVPEHELRGFATNVAVPGTKVHALCSARR